MSRAAWILAALFLAVASAPAGAAYSGFIDPNGLFTTEVLPAVLYVDGPLRPPACGAVELAAAPPILPGNRCEAHCLADFRQCEAECRDVMCLIPCDFLLNLCVSDCTSST
jgi:hypothetical protein